MTVDAPLQRVVQFFETLTPEGLPRIGEIYACDASFKDPFNEVRGATAIERIFRHMFEQVEAPRFAVHTSVAHGDQAFLAWSFSMRRKGTPTALTIRGASHLRFDASGRIRMHRDYWDAAEELYEKVPLLGTVMRWLKRRAAAARRTMQSPRADREAVAPAARVRCDKDLSNTLRCPGRSSAVPAIRTPASDSP